MQTLIKLLLSSLMLTVGGHLFAQPYLVSDDPDAFSAVFGSDGDGIIEEFQCPPWHTIGTIDVLHDGTLVHGVKFACSPLLEDGRMGNALVPQVQLGYPSTFGTDSTYQIYRDCYPKLWTGVHGNTGDRINSLGGYCGNISDVEAGQSSQTLSAVGGSGGSFAKSECEADQIPTGALVNIADAGHAQGIELICSDVYGPGGPLVGELGLLDLEANDGINPATGAPWQYGDQYRLAYVTSEVTSAYDSSIGDYNGFVRRRAHEAGHFVDWDVIGSTASVSAKDNTSTNPSVDGNGMPIFAMDGRTKIADDYNDLWDGTVDAHITVNEYGYQYAGPVFTGSGFYGEQSSDGRVLGGSTESPPKVTIADTTSLPIFWSMHSNAYATDYLPVYGLSEVLTVKATNDGPAPPTRPRDSDFDGIPDAQEPMCANNPDPLCYLRELQHGWIMHQISLFPGLGATQLAQADADAEAYFATENPLYTCTEWADRQHDLYMPGFPSHDFTQVCSDFDFDGIANANDAFPIDSSWSCDHSTHSDQDCAANYGQIEDIYLSVHGTATDPSLVSAMRSNYLGFAAGQKTCVDVLQDVVNAAGVDIEPHYLACASDQSRRSAELASMICNETGSNSIYSPERCHLGKPLYQFVSPSSFAVQADPKWYNWLGIGEMEFKAKNDFTCYRDSQFDAASSPQMSSGSNHLCFDGNSANADTIFIGNEPLYGRSQTLLEQIESSHEHTYVQWDYTFRDYDTYFGAHFGTQELNKPVLVDNNFDFEVPTNTEVAMQMENQSCWRDGKNIKEFSTGDCEVNDFAVTDKTPDNDPHFTNNTITPIAEFYSQPATDFSDGGFMLNRCRVKTEYDNWLSYIADGQNKPNLTSHAYEYSCSIDSDRLESLITSSLIAEEAERIGMYQALAEVGLMAISNVVGLTAASKFATAGTKLAKAVNYATRAWEGIEASLEISSIAAQVYVLAAVDIPRCRQETGADKEACFALSLGGTLISLASAAGEDQLYSRSATLMEDMSRQVPNEGQALGDNELVTNQIYGTNDFRGQIEATRQLVEAETGEPDVHHQVWSAVGMDLPGLMGQLNADGEGALANDLNSALYDLPAEVRELDIFKRTVLEIFNDAEGLGTVEKSTKLLDLANGFSAIAGDLSDSDLRALESMSSSDFNLFADLVSDTDGVTWTSQNPRQFLDSFKQPAAVGGACYVG